MPPSLSMMHLLCIALFCSALRCMVSHRRCGSLNYLNKADFSRSFKAILRHFDTCTCYLSYFEPASSQPA